VPPVSTVDLVIIASRQKYMEKGMRTATEFTGALCKVATDWQQFRYVEKEVNI
jgi:hypothetical protein